MIHPETQIGSLSALEQMIALGDIEGQVQAFLLSCKVDELSPATLRDYTQKLRALTRFCRGLEIASTKDITVSHVRLFLLKPQETNSPVDLLPLVTSLCGYRTNILAPKIVVKGPDVTSLAFKYCATPQPSTARPGRRGRIKSNFPASITTSIDPLPDQDLCPTLIALIAY
jgi:hypothetical protein